jgi:hypothetical protein
MNNAGEGMNYAQKKSDMASKPSQSMSKSAQAIHNHSEIKSKDRISNLTRMMNSTPLHIDGNVHDIDLHAQLTKRASHILLNEYVKVSRQESFLYLVFCETLNLNLLNFSEREIF